MSHTPKHARTTKPDTTKPSIARRAFLAAGTLAATGAAIATLGLAPKPAPSVAFLQPAAYAASAITPAAKTCAAFTAWQQHPTRGNLRALITDSLYVPWNAPGSKYGLGSDVYGLGADVLAGKTQYVSKESGYVSKDCAGI